MAIGSGARVLRVLEALATYQPVGPRSLARILGDDKSAVHRALTTLVAEGWAMPSVAGRGRYEVAPHIMDVADRACGGHDLKRRARPFLERLRDACEETAVLILFEHGRLVIADVVESRRIVRVVPPVAVPVTVAGSAGGRAILACLDPVRMTALLGHEPDVAVLRIAAETRARGYAVSERETDPGATALGAAVRGHDGTPQGALAVIGPYDRLCGDRFAVVGDMLVDTTAALSRRRRP